MPLSPRLRWKLDQIRKKTSGAFGGEKEPPRPKLCPSCGTLVGANATRCHQCGANLTFSLAAASKSLSRLMPSTSPVTYTILALCCVLYIVSLLLTIRIAGFTEPGGGVLGMLDIGIIRSNTLYELGSSIPLPLILALHQPWRFVTAIFLHVSLLHIIFNMWVLMDVGPQIEELYGSARYIFIYVFTGVVGFVLSSAAHRWSVGASGALLGLIGVLLALSIGRKSAGMQMLRGQLIVWLVIIFVWGFLSQGVDNYAHAGGLVSGFVLGKIMSDRAPVTPESRKRADLLGWSTALVVAASFVAMALWLHSIS